MGKTAFIGTCIAFLIILSAIALADGLSIRDVRVSVDYDEAYTYRLERKDRLSSESGLSNGSTIRAQILPSSNVTITFWIENTFRNSNTDISGILPKVTIKDLDDDSDMELEEYEIDLDEGNEERVDVKFQIPLDADAITYDVTIEAIAEEEGVDYDTEFLLKMPVTRQSHDIRITSSSLNPGIVGCQRKASISATIANAGSSDEEDLAVEFKSAALGISAYEDKIFLESSEDASIDDRSYTKTLNFEVPVFVKSGKYPIMVNLYWKKYILFDKKQVDLIVRDCESSTGEDANSQSLEGQTGSESSQENAAGSNSNSAANTSKIEQQESYQDGRTISFESALSGGNAPIIIFFAFLIIATIAAAAVIFYPRK